MEEDAVENLSKMAVKVLWDVATDVSGFSQLATDAFQCLFVDAHSVFLKECRVPL